MRRFYRERNTVRQNADERAQKMELSCEVTTNKRNSDITVVLYKANKTHQYKIRI